MDWLASFFTGGASAALGGIFGGLFGLGKAWMEQRHEREMAKINAQERIADRQHELAVMDKEAEKATRLMTIEAEKEISLGDLESLRKSIDAEQQGATWSKGWGSKFRGTFGGVLGALIAFALGVVDVIRGLFRPVAACFLMGATLKMYLDLSGRIGALGAMSSDQAFEIYMQIVGMLLFLTGTAVGWYFGARPASRSGRLG